MTPDAAESPILSAHRIDVERGHVHDQHQHAEPLLAWSQTATVAVHAGSYDWLLPPTHALWIPRHVPHGATGVRPGSGYVITFDANRRAVTATEPISIRVTPLIRELIVFLDHHREHTRTRSRAESLLLDLLEPASTTAFRVPLPKDPRIREIADALIADPADTRDLPAWADETNTGVRTITRLFVRETGMGFAQWRTHLRARAAIGHLARGATVGATARAVGYRKPAAFAEAFRRVTGTRPTDVPPQ